MEIKFVYKWIGRLGLILSTISVIELIFMIIFSSVVSMDLNSVQYHIGSIIYTSGFMSFHAILMHIIIISTMIIFILCGLILYRVSIKKALEDLFLSKFILLIGLFFITGGFFKITFLVFLGKSEIDTGIINLFFQDAVLSTSYTPLFGAIMWMYFYGVICCFLLLGLVISAVGLKWILNLQENK